MELILFQKHYNYLIKNNIYLIIERVKLLQLMSSQMIRKNKYYMEFLIKLGKKQLYLKKRKKQKQNYIFRHQLLKIMIAI